MDARLNRRQLALGAAAATQAGAAHAADADPRSSALGQVKMLAALDDGPAYWVYPGVVYAVRPGVRPIPILALTGCQATWARRLDDGSYRVGGALLTFFRDVGTGAFLDAFDNPFTGKRNAVAPNMLSGGRTIYPADGGSARAEIASKGSVTTPKGFTAADPAKALGRVQWTQLGASIQLMTDRSWNVAVQPQLEAQTQTAEAKAFFDPRVTRLPVRFTASTIIPWMTWLDMGDAPGHLLWHSSGEKLFSPDDIPADYRAHAGPLMDRLTAPPAL